MTLMRSALPLVEACVDSVETARAAAAAGASRVELCGPGDGGTTPSLGLIARCREMLDIPIHVMIRPRPGNFVYSDDEYATMANDIAGARGLGADGAVFGMLHPDATIDDDRLGALVAIARPMRVAFHRAFDSTPVPDAALDTLLALGVDLVLTSGHAATALDGRAQLAQHQARAGNRLTVLAGGSIRAHNVWELVTNTGIREVHARATDSNVFSALMHALKGAITS